MQCPASVPVLYLQLKLQTSMYRDMIHYPTCYDVDETFAELYKMYYTQDRVMLSDDVAVIITEANEICKEMYDCMVAHNTTEYGPGIVLKKEQ